MKNSRVGSLRDVLTCINDGDEIRFLPLLKDSILELDLNTLMIDKHISIISDPVLNITITAKNPINGSFQHLIQISPTKMLVFMVYTSSVPMVLKEQRF